MTVSDFRSTHSARSRGRVYGRFVGRVHAAFELPEKKPLPERAQALLDEFNAPEEPAIGPETPTAQGEGTEPAAGAVAPNLEPAAAEAALAPGEVPAPASKKLVQSQVPLFLLVAVGAVAIFSLCDAARAVIWLVFLLPTLLLRRILRGALSDSTGVRVVSVVMVLGQLGCLGVLGGGWWLGGCKDLSVLPVLGLVFGVFATSALPSNVPLLVNAVALGLALGAWCSALGKRCQEAPSKPPISARPSVNDPGVPRTNADGSWPRRPPRDLPENAKEQP